MLEKERDGRSRIDGGREIIAIFYSRDDRGMGADGTEFGVIRKVKD